MCAVYRLHAGVFNGSCMEAIRNFKVISLFSVHILILLPLKPCMRYTAHSSMERKATDGCVLIYLARQLAGHVSVIFTNALHAYLLL